MSPPRKSAGPPRPISHVDTLLDDAPRVRRVALRQAGAGAAAFDAAATGRCDHCGRAHAACACIGLGSKSSGRWVRRGRNIIVT